MKKYLITKTVTVELEVLCKNEGEARKWADAIVATLEDGEGKAVELSASMDFVAYSNPSECLVEVIS